MMRNEEETMDCMFAGQEDFDKIVKDEQGCIYSDNKKWFLGVHPDLTSYSILEGTQIMDVEALCSKNLKNLFCPSSLCRFSTLSFYRCSNLESIEIDERNEYYQSIDGVLYSKDLKTLKNCPPRKKEFNIPNFVKQIGQFAFRNNKEMERLTIPESVEEICKGAMSQMSKLKHIAFGSSVAKLGGYNFAMLLNLEEISVSPLNQHFKSIDGMIYDKEGKKLICCPPQKSEVTLPPTLEEIDDLAFHDCDKITSVELPRSLKKIGFHSFGRCKNLKKITLPDSIETIGSNAFDGCSSLIEIDASSRVKEMAMKAKTQHK